jgi:anti-sigma factor RsiW
MPLSENDLELLETYLDGQLPMPEAERLWHRLSAEPELADELEELRGARTVRSAVWQAMEPGEAATDAIVKRIESSVRSHRWRENVQHWSTRFAAVAACIVISYQLGWYTHGTGGLGGRSVGTPASNIQPVELTQNQPAAGSYQVAIKDASGNVMGTPTFTTPQEAVDFVNALNSMQAQPQSPLVMPAASPFHRDSGKVVPASDEQF